MRGAQKVTLVCSVIVALAVTQVSAQEEGFGFWVSEVECKAPDEKPVFSFDGEMVCGCVKGTTYSGACLDLGQKVKELSPAETERLAKEMSTKAPAPTPADQCQTIPMQFLESGTGDSGADFDQLYDAAVNSKCNQTELEWRARDCRDALIPCQGAEGCTELQDRSTPTCPLECEVLFLNVSTNCPEVYQMLKLSQFADICPGLKTVQLADLATPPMAAAVPEVSPVPAPEIPVVVPEVAPPVPEVVLVPPVPEVVVPEVVPEGAPVPQVTVPEVILAQAPAPTAGAVPVVFLTSFYAMLIAALLMMMM